MTRAHTWLWATISLTAAGLAGAAALAPPAGAPAARALSWLLFTGSSVHVASTGWLFTVPEVRAYARAHRVRCRWIPAVLIVAGACAAATVSPAVLGWLMLPYFGWQFHHYQKQNAGIAALAASAARVHSLSAAERRPLLLAGAAAIAALGTRPGLLGLRTSPLVPALFPAAGAAYAVAVAAGLAALARRPVSQRPAGFCACYLTALAFMLPVFCFSSPYAAIGGTTVAHGMQYLLLVGLVAAGGQGGRGQGGRGQGGRGQGGRGQGGRGQGGRGGAGRAPRAVRLLLLGNIALIGGAALSGASHLHGAAMPWRPLFGAYLGAVMAHFVIDAGLWRMRDPLARGFVSAHLPYLVPAPAGRERRAAWPPVARLPMDRQPI